MNEFLGIPYLDGKDDCYGLCRKYYHLKYGLKLTNYARPLGFNFKGLNLISENLLREGFEYVDVSHDRLELGDGIVMAIAGALLANHVGVYVGNNFLLHHLYQKKSCKENFGPKWRARVLNIVRHPTVTEINRERKIPELNILELLPPHVRFKVPT